jgi:signal transduction histidine kinase
MPKQKKTNKFISPMSALFNIGATFAATIVILRPTISEFLLALVLVDNIAFFITNSLTLPVIYRLFPKTEQFYHGVDHVRFGQLSFDERLQLIENMMRFPKRFATFAFFMSYFKALPTYFVIVFYWQHEVSNLMQFLIALGISSFCFCYFYGCVLFDTHAQISTWFFELHEKFNLSREFEFLQIPDESETIQFQEILVQVFIIVFMLSLQGTIVISNYYYSNLDLLIKLSIVGVSGLALFTRIWYMGRKELNGGLHNIFHKMSGVDLNQGNIFLPLHSSPLLARFERTFNLLNQRISVSERKLRNLVLSESEKSRYHALGEMSALIAHDLSAPMHGIQYCFNEINEHKLPDNLRPYLNQMELNINQGVDLIAALRARLKNTSGISEYSEFKAVHEHVIKLFQTQFGRNLIQKISFELDSRLDQQKLAIPRVDLIQILDNIYRNSVKNLIESKVENPFVKISVIESQGALIKIAIIDNGTGLSLEDFHAMTEMDVDFNCNPLAGRSLGLRLTRRLVEQYGGALILLQLESSPNKAGTEFWLILRAYI